MPIIKSFFFFFLQNCTEYDAFSDLEWYDDVKPVWVQPKTHIWNNILFMCFNLAIEFDLNPENLFICVLKELNSQISWETFVQTAGATMWHEQYYRMS